MINKLVIFKLLLNNDLKGSASKGDHIPTLESYFSRLSSIGSDMEGPLKVIVKLSSLSEKV